MTEVLLFGLSPNRGGIETYLKKIWDHIDHSRYHFSFIDMTGEGRTACFYQELSASGCDFYRITPRSESPIKNKRDLEALFREHRFDIFHFNVNTMSYLLPVEIALKAGCKVVIHSRNAGADYSMLTRVLHSVNRFRAQALPVHRIAVSPMAGKWLFGKAPFAVYYNGIDTQRFQFSQEARSRARQALDCGEDVIIGNVGVFFPAKNHPFMLEAFPEIRKRVPNAKLWFVGDGPLLEGIQRQVEEKGLTPWVRFLGKRSDMPDIYAALDFFWLPSLYEGFPNAALEAQCEGLPCLISDCIPQDVLRLENAAGMSLKKKPEEWAEKIVQMLAARRENRREAAAEINEKGFSVEQEILRLERLYASLLEEEK